MKTLLPSSSMFRVMVGLSCLSAGIGTGLAQQSSQQPAYGASTYYPAQSPTVGDRIRNAGQSVGDFVRRKFYGESAPGAAAPQQPVYQRPLTGGQPVYRQARYNLDAPATPEPATGGTGFQQPVRGTTPKYAPPPRSEPQSAAAEKTPVTKPKPKPAAPAPTASKKHASEPELVEKTRYTPAKPSTFAKQKPVPKTERERSRVEDAPPPTRPTTIPPPLPPEPPVYEAPPEPKVEARLNNDRNARRGGEMTPSSSGGISPTVGGSDFDLGPKGDILSEPPAKTSPEKSSVTKNTSGESGAESKSSGSFLIGKKTSKAGRVVSPYAPYNELDITGLPTGSLALDPTTQKVFQVP